ncbi:unnamed protein product [Calypogeia fissa]
MNKFNLPRRNIARERRAKRAERRKLQSGNPSLKVSPAKTKTSISGKKHRKLLKKWQKAQRQALESGLVTMQDIEMMAADGEAGESSDVTKTKTKKNKRVFAVKKRAKLRLKLTSSLKAKSKGEHSPADADGDTMMR